MFNFCKSPRTSDALGTNGLVEVENKASSTNLRMLLHDTSGNWSVQLYLFAYAHNNQPLSHLHISPYERVFHIA